MSSLYISICKSRYEPALAVYIGLILFHARLIFLSIYFSQSQFQSDMSLFRLPGNNTIVYHVNVCNHTAFIPGPRCSSL